VNPNIGKYIIIFGVLAILVGLIVYLFHDKLNWVGRLPGDIRVEKKNFRFYFPITTMVIASLLAALVIQIVKRFL
jgi:uncharacterized membrane protein